MPTAKRAPTAILRSSSALKKERILSAAEYLFAQKTFVGTSIRDIAKAARVNIASIYYYFPNKRSIHSEVLERAYARLHSYVEKAAAGETHPRKRLHNVLSGAAQFLNENPTDHRIMLQVGLEESLELDGAIQHHLRRTRSLLNETLEEGIRLRFFHPVDVEVFSFGLISALIGFFTSRFTFNKLFARKDPEALFNQSLPFPILEMTLKGLSVLDDQEDKE